MFAKVMSVVLGSWASLRLPRMRGQIYPALLSGRGTEEQVRYRIRRSLQEGPRRI